jgi:hypothetical protein
MVIRHSLALGGLLSLLVPAQAAQQQASHATTPTTAMEAGTLLYVELSKTVDAKKAKPGDVVKAQLMTDVLSHGKIIYRHDTKLIGHVSEAQPRTKETPESRLGIVFDKVLLKGGEEADFSSVIIALRPAPRLQITSMSPPVSPGSAASYPIPNGSSMPTDSTRRDQPTRSVRQSATRSPRANQDLAPSDIEGLSLEQSGNDSGRVVVSPKQTVKLESGVTLELRVISSK